MLLQFRSPRFSQVSMVRLLWSWTLALEFGSAGAMLVRTLGVCLVPLRSAALLLEVRSKVLSLLKDVDLMILLGTQRW